MQIKEQVQVLIIGGGITGLSAALFLLKHGIKPIVIEKHKGVSTHPRSRGFDIRTMELYRELGLSETIRKAGEVLAPAWGIHTNKSLAAYLKKTKPKIGIKSPVQLKGLESLVALTPEVAARRTSPNPYCWQLQKNGVQKFFLILKCFLLPRMKQRLPR